MIRWVHNSIQLTVNLVKAQLVYSKFLKRVVKLRWRSHLTLLRNINDFPSNTRTLTQRSHALYVYFSFICLHLFSFLVYMYFFGPSSLRTASAQLHSTFGYPAAQIMLQDAAVQCHASLVRHHFDTVCVAVVFFSYFLHSLPFALLPLALPLFVHLPLHSLTHPSYSQLSSPSLLLLLSILIISVRLCVHLFIPLLSTFDFISFRFSYKNTTQQTNTHWIYACASVCRVVCVLRKY